MIPVALPGIRDEDMKRLGAGTLFQEVNWADFRHGAVDSDAIEKLRAAMLGQPSQRDRGPSRLTPYLIRRDAGRWEESKRKDHSILYRGRQLKDAYALRAVQPDLTSGDAIFAFLSESSAAQARKLRLVAFLAVAAAVVIGLLGLYVEKEGRVALSRFVASEARQAPSPDTGLLLAVQAASIVGTPEAHGALLERLDAQPFLRHMTRIGDAEVLSVAFDPAGKLLYAGMADGKIMRVDLQTMARTQLGAALGSPPMAMDVDGRSGELWVGTQDGHVHVLGQDGTRIAGLPIGTERMPILSLQVDATGQWVAVGTHDHQLALLDREHRSVLWGRRATAQRVTAVSFSVDGEDIAAASSDGAIDFFQTRSGELRRQESTARTGNPRALQFARNGDLRAVDDGNMFWVFPADRAREKTRQIADGLLSVAAIGPRVERGPLQRMDLVTLGFGSGDVSLTSSRAYSESATVVRAHARTVHAIAVSHDGQLAASGAGDGSLALWDLQRRSLLFAPSSPPGGEFIALTYDGTGSALAVSSADDAAMVVELTSSGWRTLADLSPLSREDARSKPVAQTVSASGSGGFEPIPEKVISAAAFAPRASHLAWATRTGALAWTPWPMAGAPQIVRHSGVVINSLAIGDEGRLIFAAERDSNAVFAIDPRNPLHVRSYRLNAPIRSLEAASRGQAVFVVSDDKTLRHLDFSGQMPRETSKVELGVVAGSLARESGGGLIVVAGAGSSAGVDVGVVDRRGYRRLHSRRVGGTVVTLAISRSAGIVAAGDHDGRLHLWDLETLIPMASLQVSTDALTNMAISPNGQELSIGSLGGEMFRLSLDRKRWLLDACHMVGRELTLAEWVALVPGSRPSNVCGFPPKPQP